MLHKSKPRIFAAILTACLGGAISLFSASAGEWGTPFFLAHLLLSLGMGILVYLRFTPPLLLQKLLLFLFPIGAFYGLETFTHNPLKMEFLPQVMNWLIFWGFYLLLFALLGSLKRSAILGNILIAAVGIANHYVMEFRDNPILPWDIKSASTAFSVTDNYQFTLPATMAFTLFFFLYLCILAEKCTLKTPAAKGRAALGVASFCLLWAMKAAMCTTAVTDQVLTFSNLFTQWATYRDNGFIVSFIQYTKYLRIDKPEGYSKAALEEEALPYIEAARAGKNTETRSPNIIVIMNEAFSDLAVLHDFQTTEDYMPYIHSLQQGGKNAITGNCYVSVVGGNTANTEYEFLTGDSLAFLPSGSVAYQQYISEELPSMASLLGSLGYRTVAMHPYLPGGWNRDSVYPRMGFSESYFRSSYHNPQIIRKYVSDRSCYEKIQELYENKKEGEKLFCFNVTMQNHGGYSQAYDNFKPTVELLGIQNNHKSATDTYLTLIKESDTAFEEMIHYFENEKEETIILMFGDHQPNDYVAECIASLTGKAMADRSLEEGQNRFIVPFVLWANFDIEERRDVTTSANYLGTLLLKTAGLPLDAYRIYLDGLSETLPVVTAGVVIDKERNYYPVSKEHPYQEQMEQYWRFQYSHLFDTGRQPEGFFTLPESMAE